MYSLPDAFQRDRLGRGIITAISANSTNQGSRQLSAFGRERRAGADVSEETKEDRPVSSDGIARSDIKERGAQVRSTREFNVKASEECKQ